MRLDSFDLGLDTNFVHYLADGSGKLLPEREHPEYWMDDPLITLSDSGLHDEKHLDLDASILVALDQIETLEIAKKLRS